MSVKALLSAILLSGQTAYAAYTADVPIMTPAVFSLPEQTSLALYPLEGTEQITGLYIFPPVLKTDWPQWSTCTSVIAHRGEPATSFLRQIDALGGWRNAACPEGICHLQFAVPAARIWDAIRVLEMNLGEPVTAADVAPRRAYLLANNPNWNIPPALTDAEIARSCNLLLQSPGTLLLVGKLNRLSADDIRSSLSLSWPGSGELPAQRRNPRNGVEAGEADWVFTCPMEIAHIQVGFRKSGYTVPDTTAIACIPGILLRLLP